MAANEQNAAASGHDEDDLKASENYQAPAKKSLDEIIQQDDADESLRKYKEALLGKATKAAPIPFPNDARRVIVQKMSLLANDKEIELDLGGDLSKLKKQPFTIKEGSEYRIRVYFYVQREIVSGLKYLQVISRGPLKDKQEYMVGSYGPADQAYSYTTQPEEAPKGMLARGDYTVKSRFTDDDGHDHLTWEWTIHIGKEWHD